MQNKANNFMKTGIKLKVCGMRDKQNIIDVCCLKPVSYTHLTLPTIYSV